MPRIVILGGGFAGVKCARVLRRKLHGEGADVVLFDRENHLVFSPLLGDVVGSSLNPLDVVVPVRSALPGVYCRTEEVQHIDPAANEVAFEAPGGRRARLRYDHLVIACGNVPNLQVVPGMADHAFPLKSIGDALALRQHIIGQMEKAEVVEDPQQRRWYLAFVVVGAGYTGVEVAGEINDLVRSSARHYRNFRAEDVSVTLIYSTDEILPEISPKLREVARKQMERAGVSMLPQARVAVARSDGVGLGDGRFLRGGTIVCTIGSSTAPVIERLAVEKQKGRLLTEPDMRLRGHTNVWAIGDCAYVTNAFDRQPSPPTGQFAERQGHQVALNILRVLRGEPTRPFAFKPLGQLCSIGGHRAVAEVFGLRLSGVFAWLVWRGIYLLKLPSWARRLRTVFDWTWLLLFPRDLSFVRPRSTDRVGHAHYAPGDYIFKQGDPPQSFYVIEEGEVEAVRATPENPDGEVLAVLGPGRFFGETALVADAPRLASVRARTSTRVLVMGRNVFDQLSKTLGPFRDALAHALNRRTADPWKDRPEMHQLLQRTSVGALTEPPPQPLLTSAATMRDAAVAFAKHGHEFFFVSDDGHALDGVVTMTDLIRAHSTGAPATTSVSELMVRRPVTLVADDTCATAMRVFGECQLETLPVVEGRGNGKLVGCLRVRRLIAHVLQELPAPDPGPGSPVVSPGP